MDNLNLISNFAEFKGAEKHRQEHDDRRVGGRFPPRPAKQYETDENFDVIINPERATSKSGCNRTVVADGEVENPQRADRRLGGEGH